MTATRHVLIVDDDPDMLEVIEWVLRDAGFETRTAPNGREALQLTEAELPGLIVLDMLMPVMDGREFVKAFRARYGSRVPIVIVTAAEHTARRADGLEVAEVLGKPFEVDDLLRAVERHLRPTRPHRDGS